MPRSEAHDQNPMVGSLRSESHAQKPTFGYHATMNTDTFEEGQPYRQYLAQEQYAEVSNAKHMVGPEMDETDRRIIHCLQGDARNVTTTEIGEKLGVSGSTVANRISRLEESGIIAGYTPIIDYDRCGLSQYQRFVGTVDGDDREEILAAIPDLRGVVHVTTLLTDRRNVAIEVVAEDPDDIERLAADLSALGVTVVRTDVVTSAITHVFDGFGKRKTDDE